MTSRFHYAFKVRDITSTREFYVEILGCMPGRYTETWIDFNFFGHQLSAHVSDQIPALDYCGEVDGHKVPVPHFGCILSSDQFEVVRSRLEQANIAFVIAPYIRYEGTVGEQMTMFVLDFSGNPIEFKSYSNEEEVFK